MNYSLIDIGSNSIRLTVYELNGTAFKPLFHSKIMAGLAGYVEKDKLSKDSIKVAKEALLEFKRTLEALHMEQVSVFATASLRNIENTKKVVRILNETTGFSIKIIDEQDEALLSYQGAKLGLPEITGGALIDVGGASTEIISFADNTPLNITSYPLGSLNLYKKCVRKILPGEATIQEISKTIDHVLEHHADFSFQPSTPLVCVGGTARALLKIARKVYDLPDTCNTLSKKQMEELFQLLSNNIRLILRMAPDRIHTLVPGLCIIMRILHLYHSEKIVISSYGIREGFLCKEIIPSNTTTTSSLKTEK